MLGPQLVAMNSLNVIDEDNGPILCVQSWHAHYHSNGQQDEIKVPNIIIL
jgi:hypothetical protein